MHLSLSHAHVVQVAQRGLHLLREETRRLNNVSSEGLAGSAKRRGNAEEWIARCRGAGMVAALEQQVGRRLSARARVAALEQQNAAVRAAWASR